MSVFNLVDRSNSQVRSQLSSQQLEKLLRGQGRLEGAIGDLQRSLDELPQVLRQVIGHKAEKTSEKDECESALGDVASVECLPPMDKPLTDVFGPSAAIGELQSAASFSPATSHVPSGTSASAMAMLAASTRNRRSFISPSPPRLSGYEPRQQFADFAAAMRRNNYARVTSLAKARARPSSMNRAVGDDSSRSCIGQWPLHPTSMMRSLFDCLSTLVLGLEAILVPFVIAFDVKAVGTMRTIGWLICGFWTVDLFMNFATGYIKGSVVIVSWRSIAKRYLRRGFVVDLCVLLLDYLDILSQMFFPDATSGPMKVFRFIRFTKISRLIRVFAKLRLGLLAQLEAAMSYVLHVYGLAGYKDVVNLAGILIKLTFLISWLSHLGSCCWCFAVRSWTKEADKMAGSSTWYGEIADSDAKSNFYVHGLYWSVTTMFSGASYLTPNSHWESIFSGVFIIMGALFVTAVTSTLAAILIDASEEEKEMKKNVRLLAAFLESQGTPGLLALAIRADFIERVSEAPRVTEINVPNLALVDAELRSALRECQYSASFRRVAFFRLLDLVFPGIIRELCFTTSSFHVAKAGEELFSVDTDMAHTLLLVSGSMRYTHQSQSRLSALKKLSLRSQGRGDQTATLGSAGMMRTTLTIDVETWICELALLLQWRTTGSLEAATSCDMLIVSVDSFAKVISNSPLLTALVSAYSDSLASSFDFDVEGWEVTDIAVDIDIDCVLASLPVPVKSELVSMPALDIIRDQFTLPRSIGSALSGLFGFKNLSGLEEEIHAGKSQLVVSATGEVQRIVRLTVLSLKNEEGRVCVHLGEHRTGAVKPRLQLPARKVEGEETPQDTLKKLIDEDFGDLAPNIQTEGQETVIEYEYSATFGVVTKYIKTVLSATLHGSMLIEDTSEMLLSLGSTPDIGAKKTEPQPWSPMRIPSRIPSAIPGRTPSRMPSRSPSRAPGAAPTRLPFSMAGVFAMEVGPDVEERYINLYKWFYDYEYDDLAARREDCRGAVHTWLQGLQPTTLHNLAVWSLRKEVRVRNGGSEHNGSPAQRAVMVNQMSV